MEPPLPASAPMPDLRIVPTASVFPHEEVDSQRLRPLVERIRRESHVINPPIIAPMGDGNYVVLDGANRAGAFAELGYPHMLVQVVEYENGTVELENWQHVVCQWSWNELTESLHALPNLLLNNGEQAGAVAHLIAREGNTLSLHTHAQTRHDKNAALREAVAVYQRSAVLQRTAETDPAQIFPLHPDGAAVIAFARYHPADIIAAARDHAYLPPGISRHVVHGRALLVNYPLEALRDPLRTLDEKNADLHAWVLEKIAHRSVRYYAESTYQFDE